MDKDIIKINQELEEYLKQVLPLNPYYLDKIYKTNEFFVLKIAELNKRLEELESKNNLTL